MLEEKQLKFPVERYGNIAHLWSSYALHSDGKKVARGINSFQAIKVADGWRVMVIMAQAEAATAPLAKENLRKGASVRAASLHGRLRRAFAELPSDTCRTCSLRTAFANGQR